MKKILHTLKYYAGIYGQFFSTCAAESMSFRFNFFLYILLEGAFYLGVFGPVEIILKQLGHAGVWNHSQWMFFLSFVLTIDWLHMLIVSENFWMLAEHIRMGGVDYALLRPASALFTLFFRQIRVAVLPNGLLCLSLLIYFGQKAHLTPWAFALLPLMLLFAFATKLVFEIIMACGIFWVTEGLGVNFIRIQTQALARWPEFVYRGKARLVFVYLFPVLLMGSGPVHFLFDFKNYAYLLLQGILTQALMLFLAWLWPLALKHYESASS